MGLIDRFMRIFRMRAEDTLEKMEDPRKTLDYSLVEMNENLRKIERSLLDISTAKQKLVMQRDDLAGNIGRYNGQARQALEFKRDDLAQVAIGRKQELEQRLGEVEQNMQRVEQQMSSLESGRDSLKAKIESFKGRKEELKAMYGAAEAQVRIKETLTGISEELTDVGQSITRAEDRIKDMQARAGAIDELIARGAIEDVLGESKDEVQRELERLGRSKAVEEELTRLKKEVGPAA
ncbi:MAG: PspA/IM30 family protein [Candidatus Aquicultor sp.]